MHEDLYPCNIAPIDLPSKVLLCGKSYCDGTYKIIRPNSEIGVVEYVISGTGTIILDGKRYTASSGDTYFLPPNVDQYYYSDGKKPWIKVFINMSGNLMRLLAEEYSFGDRVIFPNCDTCSIISSACDIAKNKNYTPYEIQEKIILQIHRTFIHMYNNIALKDDLPDEVAILKNFIDTNVMKNLNLDEMASKIFCSKNYAIQLFKKSLNTTPYEYYLNKKMELAKQLLTTTVTPIKQISDYLSFDTPNYFSQSFTKKYGITPTMWRKNK